MAQYFDLCAYDGTTRAANILLGLPFHDSIQKIQHCMDECNTIIIDNLQECVLGAELDVLEPYKHKILVLTGGSHQDHPWLRIKSVPNWMWYFESPWYHDRGYHLYQPNLSQCAKLFFMPIRRRKPGRELIYRQLHDLLQHDAIFSYVDHGIELPGMPESHRDDQRWFNSDWYDKTLFSVVNEDSNDQEPKIFTEKSCKPLAFYHPFLLVAQKGVLSMIRDAGFVTFPELFDESYDVLDNLSDRVAAVEHAIRSFDRSAARSSHVIQKVKHNHDRFFDQALVHACVTEEVIEPLIDFITGSH